jgi:hypothetical protein
MRTGCRTFGYKGDEVTEIWRKLLKGRTQVRGI